jgi:PTS system galactitol-specific IIC component
MPLTNQVINKVIEIGPVAILPALLFLIGLVTTRKPLKNLLNCTYIFVGMVGLSIVLTLFINFFKPLIETILLASPKKFLIVDLGWAVSKQIILNSPITLYILIAIGALNLIMLLLRLTRTINIDLWNLWIFLLTGSIITAITEIKWLGILTAVIIYIITLVIADIYAPFLEQYFGIKGVSSPQPQFITWAPIAHIISLVFNKIPGIRRIQVFYEEIQYKLGFFGEPMVMGFILGFIAGIITKYKSLHVSIWPNILFALGMGLELAIVMILMPRLVNLIIKGLHPAMEDIKSFISRRITKRDLYIGLDSVLFVGHPSVIALSIIVVPLSVYIATLLPGNNILPAADLIIIPFILIWAVVPAKGDIFRSFISAVIIIPLTLWISSDMAILFTNFFQKYNIVLVEGVKNFSSYSSGSSWIFWILLQIIKPILNLFN